MLSFDHEKVSLHTLEDLIVKDYIDYTQYR